MQYFLVCYLQDEYIYVVDSVYYTYSKSWIACSSFIYWTISQQQLVCMNATISVSIVYSFAAFLNFVCIHIFGLTKHCCLWI